MAKEHVLRVYFCTIKGPEIIQRTEISVSNMLFLFSILMQTAVAKQKHQMVSMFEKKTTEVLFRIVIIEI